MASGARTKRPILDECWKVLVIKRQELIKRLYAYRAEMVADREGD